MKLSITVIVFMITVMLSAQDPNCLIPTSQNTCQVCNTFFYILNGRCTAVNINCLGYNSTNGRCTSCQSGYQLNSNGQCNLGSAGILTSTGSILPTSGGLGISNSTTTQTSTVVTSSSPSVGNIGSSSLGGRGSSFTGSGLTANVGTGSYNPTSTGLGGSLTSTSFNPITTTVVTPSTNINAGTIQTFTGQGTTGLSSQSNFANQGQITTAVQTPTTTTIASTSGTVYIVTSQGQAFTSDIVNLILQSILKFNSDNPTLPAIVLMTSSGQRLAFQVSSPISGRIYFTTDSGQALGASALASIQQTINTINAQYGTSIVFVSSASSTTSTTSQSTTTTQQQLTQNQVYVTTSSGQPLQVSLLTALQRALDNYNAQNPQQPAVVMIYSNGARLPTTFTAPISGPIYFAFSNGQPPTSVVLTALQLIISNINSQQTGTTAAGSTTLVNTTTTTTTETERSAAEEAARQQAVNEAARLAAQRATDQKAADDRAVQLAAQQQLQQQIAQTANSSVTVIQRQISQKTLVYVTTVSGQPLSVSIINGLLQALNNYNFANSNSEAIIMVTTNGTAILTNVTNAIMGPIYFTTATGATLTGNTLAALQQIVSSFNTGRTDFVYNNSTTTTITTTTYSFNPDVTPYITSNSGQSYSSGFIAALLQALNNYNSGVSQSNQIIIVNSNGQQINANAGTFFGPIYFLNYGGQPLNQISLQNLQQIISTLSSQWSVTYYTNSQTTTTTTYNFNPTVTPYITSNSGQSFTIGFINALILAINNYNTGVSQSNQIIMVYSNGQVIDTSNNGGSTFFGPIYFLSYGGQSLSQSALIALQQIMNTLTIQWNVTFYSTTQTTTIVSTSDPYCARYQGNSGICAVCSTRYYLNARTSRCTAVSNQCNTYDLNTGVCLSCYQGYTLSNGDCYILVTQDSYDLNCKTVAANGACQECYQGYFYSQIQFKCVISNPLCKTSTSTGSCLSCYSGYVLNNGNCLVAQSTTVGNCRNFSNGICY
jgi:hypothetical protein